MNEKDKINRRKTLKALTLVPLASGLTMAACDKKKEEGHHHVHSSISTKEETIITEKFFTDHETKTVRLLADIIIPKDERSGSASEAGVPEFIEFMMIDQPQRQVPMRGGLAWLDRQCINRFSNSFIDSTDVQQREILDEIAWPQFAKPDMSQGAAFFNNFRDLTATGFWTSKMGIEDLQYIGNKALSEWSGCPDEACKKLGVSYKE